MLKIGLKIRKIINVYNIFIVIGIFLSACNDKGKTDYISAIKGEWKEVKQGDYTIETDKTEFFVFEDEGLIKISKILPQTNGGEQWYNLLGQYSIEGKNITITIDYPQDAGGTKIKQILEIQSVTTKDMFLKIVENIENNEQVSKGFKVIKFLKNNPVDTLLPHLINKPWVFDWKSGENIKKYIIQYKEDQTFNYSYYTNEKLDNTTLNGGSFYLNGKFLMNSVFIEQQNKNIVECWNINNFFISSQQDTMVWIKNNFDQENKKYYNDTLRLYYKK